MYTILLIIAMQSHLNQGTEYYQHPRHLFVPALSLIPIPPLPKINTILTSCIIVYMGIFEFYIN